MSEAQPAPISSSVRRRRPRLIRAGGAAVACLAFLVVLLPTLISYPPLRPAMLNLVAGANKSIDVRSLSLGWFTWQSVHGLAFVDHVSGNRIDVEAIEYRKSGLSLLTNRSDLGDLTIEQPKLDLVLRPAGMQRPSTDGPLTGQRLPRGGQMRLRAEVRNGSLTVRNEPGQEPIVDLPGVHLSLTMQRGTDGWWLTAEPTKLLDRRELTVDMCRRGLQLVAPVLADAANVDGQISFQLDKFRVALEKQQDASLGNEIEGHLILHRVSAGLRNPLLMEIARVVATVVRSPLPSRVTIADESDVHFIVREGRVYHEGLAFGLPEVASDLVIRSQGSVGFDRSLDMHVHIPLPLDRIHDGPVLRMLSDQPLALQVRGTLDKPVVSLPNNRQWYSELASRLGVPLETDSSGATFGDASSVQSALEAAKPLAETVLDSVADLFERRRQRLAEQAKRAGSEPDSVRDRAAMDRDEHATRPVAPATPFLDRMRARRETRRTTEAPPP